MAKHLLIELGTEELPPKALKTLSDSFSQAISDGLKSESLTFESSQSFATPRRLGIIIHSLDEQQADRSEQKLGPNVKAAYDNDGKPTKAAEGFAKSCGVAFDQLETVQTDKGERLSFELSIKGKSLDELIAPIIEQALAALPIPKRMRWGANRAEFVRPVKWLTLVFGDTVVPATIMGVTSSNTTRGHRFHANGDFVVNAENYEQLLQEKFVVADFSKRQSIIKDQVLQQAAKLGGTAQISDDLLNEVTALVEWPVALTGKFEERFLDVPSEALISSMVEHQKYFHVLDTNGTLLPNFITVANIASKDPAQVIDGNERVIRPRLADAAFFFETDKKATLASRLDALKKIVFQKELGTVFEKTERVSILAGFIADQIGASEEHAQRAGVLAKTDLVSEMVLEFASLQGLMGMHYARNDGEVDAVATAIYEQYLPKGAGGELPSTAVGAALSLADRIDTLIGIFGIGQLPTGNKDPFALRRQALAIINIIVDKSLNLDLEVLYRKAFSLFQVDLDPETVDKALDYTIERFRAYYQAQGLITEIYLSVAAKNISKPLDFDARVKAVASFNELTEAADLAAANKRVANILAKQNEGYSTDINEKLFVEEAEKKLSNAMRDKQAVISDAVQNNDYQKVLYSLADLKDVIDAFFDQVMVMTDDETLKNNRIALLAALRGLFLQVADISLLAKK